MNTVPRILRWHPIRIITAMSLTILAGTLVIIYQSYHKSVKWRKDAIGHELLAVARTTAGLLDPIELQALARRIQAGQADQKRLANSPQFLHLRSQLHRVVQANQALSFGQENLYIFVPHPRKPHTVLWAVMLHQNTFIG